GQEPTGKTDRATRTTAWRECTMVSTHRIRTGLLAAAAGLMLLAGTAQAAPLGPATETSTYGGLTVGPVPTLVPEPIPTLPAADIRVQFLQAFKQGPLIRFQFAVTNIGTLSADNVEAVQDVLVEGPLPVSPI